MKRKGFISQNVETSDNFYNAYVSASEHKHKRNDIRKFEEDLDKNLENLFNLYCSSSLKYNYTYFNISDPKPRLISKLDFPNHVAQWAVLNYIEDYMTSTFIRNTFSCIKGRGTHDLYYKIRHDLENYPERLTRYALVDDIKKFYQNIDHDILKEQYRRKIKDPKIIHFIDELIDSFNQGLPLGIKFSQLSANVNLAQFDHDAKKCFWILKDVEKLNYYTARYVSDKFVTARTEEDLNELSKGVEYLSAKFRKYCKRIDFYYRYADDILVLHEDRTFLHILNEMIIIHINHDCLLKIKNNWRVIDIEKEGLDYVGYKHYHSHAKVRKRNKVALCREVAKLRKKGNSDHEIYLKASSRIGFAVHANSKNLIRKLKMENERLGSIIKKRRIKPPFKDMEPSQKASIESVVYDTIYPDGNEEDKLIQLIDYSIEDSIIEKNPDGSAKKRIAIRYKHLDHIEKTSEDGKEVINYHWKEEELYSFSGSKIMVSQAEEDFSKDDLPIATVIVQALNEKKKKFYKFT